MIYKVEQLQNQNDQQIRYKHQLHEHLHDLNQQKVHHIVVVSEQQILLKYLNIDITDFLIHCY